MSLLENESKESLHGNKVEIGRRPWYGKKINNADSKWVGQRFGDLVVLRFEYSESQGRYVWVCKCDCGQVVSVVPANARAGRVRSCGCAQLKSATTHGMRIQGCTEFG